MRVLLGAVLIDALHTALEDAEIAFNRVGVDRSVTLANILVGAVLNGLVIREVFA